MILSDGARLEVMFCLAKGTAVNTSNSNTLSRKLFNKMKERKI